MISLNMASAANITVVVGISMMLVNVSIIRSSSGNSFLSFWSAAFIFWLLSIAILFGNSIQNKHITFLYLFFMLVSTTLFVISILMLNKVKTPIKIILPYFILYFGILIIIIFSELISLFTVTVISGTLYAAAYITCSIIVLYYSTEANKHISPIRNADHLLGIFTICTGILFLLHSILFTDNLFSRDFPVFPIKDISIFLELLRPPVFILLNTAFILQTLKFNHEKTKRFRLKTLMALNDIYKNTIITELNSYVKKQIDETIKHLQLINIETEHNANEILYAQSSISDCISIIKKRNSMLTMEMDNISSVNLNTFLIDINTIIKIHSGQSAKFMLPKTNQYIFSSRKFLFWLLFITADIIKDTYPENEQISNDINFISHSDEKSKNNIIEIKADIYPGVFTDIQFTHFDIEEDEQYLPTSFIKRFFWLSQYVKNNFNGSFIIKITKNGTIFQAIFQYNYK